MNNVELVLENYPRLCELVTGSIDETSTNKLKLVEALLQTADSMDIQQL